MNIIYGEIKGQYEALAKTRDYVKAQAGEVRALLPAEGALVFLGSGSSYAVAKSAALTAQLRLKRPAAAIPAGDLLLHMDAYRPLLEGALVVVLSRSGETTEAVLCLENLRKKGIAFRAIGITCAEGTSLSKLAEVGLEMPWAFDNSVCQTRTVTCLYFACQYLTALLAGDDALEAALLLTIQEGPAYMAQYEETFKALAEGDWVRGVVLGDAELGGICDEGALAFKEICQLPSNFYHLLDVRHGPMVLIGKDTLVLVALSAPDNTYELALVRDLIAKGATVVCYSDTPAEVPGAVNISFGHGLEHPARGIPFIALCQLITYYKSFQTQADPDNPDGLSPWIAL